MSPLPKFPVSTLRGDRTIYRIHTAANGPWWFSDDGNGRFDPIGSGKGACYFADAPLGAWLEVFRKQMLWAEAEIAGRRLLQVTVGHDLRLADLTSRRALQFGVTASLGANEDYADSQAFAAKTAAEGFDGIRYHVRHDPKQKLIGYALFDEHGDQAGGGSWPSAAGAPIDEAPVSAAGKAFGYRVLPTP